MPLNNTQLTAYAPPVIAAAISFALSYLHTNKVIKSQAALNQISELIKKIEKVAEDADHYYITPVNDNSRNKEVIIQHLITNISREINDLSTTLTSQRNNSLLKSKMIKFRQAITGGDFRTASRQPIPPTSMLPIQISLSRDELISELKKLSKK